MPTRWVIRQDAAGNVRTSPLLNELAGMVADDMRAIVPVETGALRAGIHTEDAVGDMVRIVSSRHVAGEDPKVPIYIERGTRYMRAQPYMRPSLWKYRG